MASLRGNWVCFAYRSHKLPLFGFVFAVAEAAIDFPNPLSQFKLGAFGTSRKLPLFGFVFSASARPPRFVTPY